MSDLNESIDQIEESVTELEMLNELVNALGLAQSSNAGRMSNVQTELALSSIYSKIMTITKIIRTEVDNLYEVKKSSAVMNKGKP